MARIMIIILRLLLCVVIAVALFAAYIYFRQDSMIYYARPYSRDNLDLAPDRAVKLEYKISCGKQTAWYVPPRSATEAKALPERLWMFFGGNGSLALFWSNGVNASPDPDAGFLMFDYPGYGLCEGRPSPNTIAESGDAVLGALAGYLGVSPEKLAGQKLRLMGHSLGAAAALEFAQRHPADRIVLAAPFTTLRAMADKAVTPWLGWMLRHNFDNLSAIAALLKQQSQPRIIVTHGTADEIIPIEMSREIKRQWPDNIELIEVKGADHEYILDDIENYMTPDLTYPVTSLKQAMQAAAETPVMGRASSAQPGKNSP